MDDQQPEVSAQKLLQAISTLHQQGTPSTELAAANAWLEKFEQSTVAWQVSAQQLCCMQSFMHTVQCIGSAVNVLALGISTTAGVQSHTHVSVTICTCT